MTDLKEMNIREEISKEVVSKITPLFAGVLATLVVFTIPLWNTHPNISLIMLILLLVIPLCMCVWRLIHFIFKIQKVTFEAPSEAPSKKLRTIFIPVYTFLLLIVITMSVSGFIYWGTHQIIEYDKVHTFMTVQHSSGEERRVPFRETQYQRGSTRIALENGVNVYVIGQGINSHGNIWYLTEFGWVYGEHLLEISDREELQQLINQKLLNEAQRNREVFKIMTVRIWIIIALIFAIAIPFYIETVKKYSIGKNLLSSNLRK